MSPPGLILDASITLAWAFEDEAIPYADAVLEALAEDEALVPAIWALEVGNGLVVAERRDRLNQAATVQFLALIGQLPITVESQRTAEVFGEILALAREQGLFIYDAAYVHLAMRHGLPLATTDGVLRQAAVRLGVPVYGR
ncbi:MAG: type II toxin-antitoxin system VapC family toxin [Deltaproteobacteria bacterium]|nr:type II toxin-antitoxin system VapC family toxin [Deltaproteobacteria bacterium]